MRKTVNNVIHTELVRLIRQFDYREPAPRDFPVLTDVVIDIRDRHEPLLAIVVFEQPPVGRLQASVGGRQILRMIDFEEGMRP